MTYSTSDTFTINNISISVKRSNFTLALIKASCYANPGTVRKRAGLSSHIQGEYFESSRLDQVTIMCRFELTNHDIALKSNKEKNLLNIFIEHFY